MLKPEAPPLLSLRFPMTFFLLLLPARRQIVGWDCLKCPWAQWFQKAFVLIYQIWQDPWVRASSALHLAWKICLGIENVLFFHHQKSRVCCSVKGCECGGLTVLPLNIFMLNTWALRTYIHGFLSCLEYNSFYATNPSRHRSVLIKRS